MSIKKDRNEKKEFNIIHYQKFLNEAQFQYFYNCYLDRSEGRYLSSIIWGAVFLETFLDDLLNQLNITRRDNENMKAMMDHLYGYLKTKSPDSLNIPIEIINRCHTIRTTRNSIVHKSDVKKEESKIVADSDTVWNNLLMILDWYKETSIEQRKDKTMKDTVKQKIPVFLSTINPHSGRQIYFIEKLKQKLNEIGILTVQMKPSIYDKKDPIGKAYQTIKECEALIVLGFERTHSYFSRDKEGSEYEKDKIHRRYTSSWLHLEAGIAHSLGLKIFVVCEKEICSDGIFDRAWNSYPVLELRSLDINSPELIEFLDYVKNWTTNRDND